jgi:hypothetical protein
MREQDCPVAVNMSIAVARIKIFFMASSFAIIMKFRLYHLEWFVWLPGKGCQAGIRAPGQIVRLLT